MKILALDTSMAACSAAAVDLASGQTLAAERVGMERGHAEALPPMVARVLSQAGTGLRGFDRIIVTTGPGTFTGVRIGLAMARGMGLAEQIPVVGIDTLSAIAANGRDHAGSLMVVADARNDEVYAAAFDAARRPVMAPCILSLAEAARLAPEGAGVLGTAATALAAAAGRGDLVRLSVDDLPDARCFAALADTLDPASALPVPLYLRAPDARPQIQPLRRQAVVSHLPPGAATCALLARLHAASFDDGWQPDAFAGLMNMPGSTAMLASIGDEPAGFVLARQAADEAEVITVCVTPAHRRKGVARLLLDSAFTDMQAAGARQAFMEVAQSNTAARLLYQGMGFTEAGIRRGYYGRRDGTRDDAIVLRKALQP